MSDRLFVKLREVIHTSGTTTASNESIFVIRGNDCYDPQYSVGGSQPTGFDQYMAFYNNFYVSGSRLKVTVYSDGPADSEFYILPTKYASVAISGYDPSEYPLYRGKYVSGNGASAKSGTVLKSYRGTKQMMVVPDPASQTVFWGTDAASPTQQWYWWFGNKNPDISQPCDFNFKAEIVYYVTFFGRRQIIS